MCALFSLLKLGFSRKLGKVVMSLYDGPPLCFRGPEPEAGLPDRKDNIPPSCFFKCLTSLRGISVGYTGEGGEKVVWPFTSNLN